MRIPFSAVILLIGLLSGCGPQTPPTYTVNDPTDANTTWRADKPLTYEEANATGKCPIPLPAQAINIQYVDFYAGWGGFSRYVRFEAPVVVCEEHAQSLIKNHNSSQRQNMLTVDPERKALDRDFASSLAASAREGEPVSQAAWFDTDKIQNGVVWGTRGSHTPVVIVDKDKGVFYYHISD